MPRIKKYKIHNYETAKVVADMLVESTGTHMLDSGGASGRAWQRNQAAVAKSGKGPVAYFESLPESTFGWPAVWLPMEARNSDDYKSLGNDSNTQAELWVSHNVYHWLKEAVTYAPEVDKALDELAAEMDAGKSDWDKPSWFEIYREFPEWYAKRLAEERAEEERETRRNGGYSEEEIEWVTADEFYEPPRGVYGDGDWMEGYTYNEDNALSQDIHWIYFELGRHSSDDGITLIMIHGGADARGGFTRPHAFYSSFEGDSPTFGDWSRWGIGCTECSAIWSGNGGYDESAEWNGGDYDKHTVLPLGEYNAREGDAIDAAFLNSETGILVGDEKPWIVIEQPGQYPTSEGTKVYCPVCGKGELHPWYY